VVSGSAILRGIQPADARQSSPWLPVFAAIGRLGAGQNKAKA